MRLRGNPVKTILKWLALSASLCASQRSLGQTPYSVDATQFPGIDMCVKIQNARANSLCSGSTSGCRVFAPFTGVQQCSVDPFSGWGAGGELDLRGPQNLDVRGWPTFTFFVKVGTTRSDVTAFLCGRQ